MLYTPTKKEDPQMGTNDENEIERFDLFVLTVRNLSDNLMDNENIQFDAIQ